MNPNAKEFVPSYLLKKRQEEAVGDLAKKIGDVDLEEKSNATRQDNGETSNQNTGASTSPRTTNTSITATTSLTSENKAQNHNDKGKNNQDSSKPSDEVQNQTAVTQNNNRSNDHLRTNGDSTQQELDEDDRYLLKAGENYCEFNGEQFIIPGDDDEYECSNSDNMQPTGYDFGNVEDNEDEDVCNAYEEFLNELP